MYIYITCIFFRGSYILCAFQVAQSSPHGEERKSEAIIPRGRRSGQVRENRSRLATCSRAEKSIDRLNARFNSKHVRRIGRREWTEEALPFFFPPFRSRSEFMRVLCEGVPPSHVRRVSRTREMSAGELNHEIATFKKGESTISTLQNYLGEKKYFWKKK